MGLIMCDYLVSYKHAHGPQNLNYYVFKAPANATWRELQVIFDPRYHYNSLKFYGLGSEIILTSNYITY